MNGKQRRYLKQLAHNLDPVILIGKGGVTDALLKQIDETIAKRELIKIRILNNNFDDRDVIVDQILEETGSTFVQFIGSVLTIYRPAEEPKIEIPNK